MDVQAVFKQDVEDRMWKAWTAEAPYQELSLKPYLQPIKAWATRARNHAKAGFIRKLVSQGQVTQQTLHSWGWAETADCLACRKALGTEGHRLCERGAFHQQRLSTNHRSWQHVAETE